MDRTLASEAGNGSSNLPEGTITFYAKTVLRKTEIQTLPSKLFGLVSRTSRELGAAEGGAVYNGELTFSCGHLIL